VVEHVDRAAGEEGVAARDGVGEGPAPDLEVVVDGGRVVHDDDHLGEHHLAEAEETVRRLVGLARVLLLDRHVHEVVGDADRREGVVPHLGQDELAGTRKMRSLASMR
jgi:hypothetical protein